MASDRADSVLDAHRTSLLELIEDRNKALNKVNIYLIRYVLLKLKNRSHLLHYS